MLRKVHERLIGALSRVLAYVVVLLAPRPPLPPHRVFTLPPEPDADLTVRVMFLETDWPLTGHHVACVLDYDSGETLVVDSGIGTCWIKPTTEKTADRLVRALSPEYLVTFRVRTDGKMKHVTIGPVTCITLAKRMIGVHNPGIVTSRQLLALLWERINVIREEGFQERR